MLLSIVIPVFNEKKAVLELLRDVVGATSQGSGKVSGLDDEASGSSVEREPHYNLFPGRGQG